MLFVVSLASNKHTGDCVIPITPKDKPRIAASSYLNSAPLVWSFKHGSRKDSVELSEPVPSRCADLLAQGSVDAALIPAIEYQRIPNLELVPNICVGSREEVHSVVLLSRLDDLEKIRSIALDESSRTSATLTKVIFHEFIRTRPQWMDAKPDVEKMLSGNDAALVIGDPGMTLERQNLNVFDLASLWRKHTGRGFVFALWALSPNASTAARDIDFAAACEEGIAKIDDILDYYQPLLGRPRDDLRAYLEKNISFYMDDDLRAGLELFYGLAYKHKLIPALLPLRL